jgi:hypothetical protein
MSVISRRNFLYLLSSITFGLIREASVAETIPPTWDSIRKIEMKGNLKAFWNVLVGTDSQNDLQAIRHGFRLSTTPNSYADYPGNQRENIYNFLEQNHQNPWVKPAFFERIVKRNIKNATHHKSISAHDLEIDFERDLKKLWQDPKLRKLSKARNFKDFVESYYREWATWFSLPCKWSKQMYPHQPVGIYGPQIFNGEYAGFAKPSQLEQAHSSDLKLWKYIDPHVNFYVSSAYILYDLPDSIYAIAANIEENYRRSRKFSNKPLYAYLWLRYHPGNPQLSGQEVVAYIVEAAAIIPFFVGAKGMVLWGWEPKSKGQPYQTLPVFMNSLGRVADLSAKIDRAQLIIDRPAQELWREKSPLIRKLKVSRNEWIIMAIYPWQDDRDRKLVTVKCGNRSVKLEISGKHTEIYHLQGSNLERI